MIISKKIYLFGIVWIPLLLLWSENKEPDMSYYTVYVMDSTKTVILKDTVDYPDTTYGYTMDDRQYKILYFYVTASDTARNESLPSDTVFYKVGVGPGGQKPKVPLSFTVSEPYPSITDGQLHIDINTNKDYRGRIYCYNLLGKVIFSKKIVIEKGFNSKAVNVNGAAGLYFIAIKLGNEVVIRRVLLVK